MNAPHPIRGQAPVVDFYAGTRAVVAELREAALVVNANAKLLATSHDELLPGAMLAAAEALHSKSEQIRQMAKTLEKVTKAHILRRDSNG